MMRASLAALLTFLSILEHALSLQCYTCNDLSNLDDCMFITNCSAQTTACKTMQHSVDSGYPFFGKVTVTKTCSEKCVPSNPNGIGVKKPVFCCYTDLCNVTGASQSVTSLSAMALLAVTVFALFGARV